MNKPLAEFRRLAQHNRSGKGQGRYPARAKKLALDYMADRRAKGDSMTSVAKALGVANQTLMDWRKQKTSQAIVPVQVITEAPEASTTVYGPRGLRVEGLKMDELAELWRRLLCSA